MNTFVYLRDSQLALNVDAIVSVSFSMGGDKGIQATVTTHPSHPTLSLNGHDSKLLIEKLALHYDNLRESVGAEW